MRNTLLKLFVGVATILPLAHVQAEDFDPKTPVTELTITTDTTTFAYDIKEFTVKAGTTLKLTLVVPEGGVNQAHNLVIADLGKEAVLMQQAMAMMADPKALESGYIPEDKSSLVGYTTLLQPGSTEEFEIEIPEAAGDYQYICTFPGHFALMKGIMHVVE